MNLAKSEPVRLYLYTVLTAVAGVLVFYGVVEVDAVPLLLALGAAVLGVPAVELARAAVASPNTQAELHQASVKVLSESGYTVIPPAE